EKRIDRRNPRRGRRRCGGVNRRGKSLAARQMSRNFRLFIEHRISLAAENRQVCSGKKAAQHKEHDYRSIRHGGNSVWSGHVKRKCAQRKWTNFPTASRGDDSTKIVA